MDWNVINEERKGKRSTRSLRLKALAKDEGTVDFGGGGEKNVQEDELMMEGKKKR